jgi:hypothetical protein
VLKAVFFQGSFEVRRHGCADYEDPVKGHAPLSIRVYTSTSP